MSDIAREIEGAVRENAVFLGVTGDVVVRGTWLEVHGGGPAVAIDVGELLARWPTISIEMRRTEGYALAKRIVTERARSAQPEGREMELEDDAPAARGAGAELSVEPRPKPAPASAPSTPPQRAVANQASSGPEHARDVPSPAVTAAAIEQALRDQIGLHGASGTVYVRGTQIELHGRGAPVSIEIDRLVEQWPLFPPEMRQRKLADLARRLVAAQRGSGGAGGGRSSISLPAWVPLGGAVVVALLALYFFRAPLRAVFAREPSTADAGVATESDAQKTARRARSCEAGRRRMREGASMGVLPEGWVAELWLASSKATGDMKKNPAVLALVEGGHVAKGADPLLAGMSDGLVEVVDGFAPQDAEKSPGYKSIIVRFGGMYFERYLDLADRQRFIDIASKLSEALPADFAALYGRCEHLAYHDVGAWYRGADLGAVTASLVYSAGFFAEPSAVNRAQLRALGTGGELDNLRAAGSKLDQATLAGLVGPQGGTLFGTATKAMTLTFPAAGPTRATRASRAVAKKLGVGTGAD